jgi:hypothetical protein
MATTIANLTALDQRAINIYRAAMDTLERAHVPFMVGGAYALAQYTDVTRHTKDFDLFVLPADIHRALAALSAAGYSTELTADYWLGKAFAGDDYVDLIFGGGNGIARVDEEWFAHAIAGDVFGERVKLIPPEEMIWSKSFIMERERYDGADIAHVLLKRGAGLDWRRLLARFGANWAVLLNYLVLFSYMYPGQRDCVPLWVMDDLLGRLQEALHTPEPRERVCNGTLLSRYQFLSDVRAWGFTDGRVVHGYMRPDQIEEWTEPIAKDGEVASEEASDAGRRSAG